MALIQCPECQHNVSDTAHACPSCGYSFKRSTFEQFVGFAVRCLVVLIVLTLLLLFLSSLHLWLR
jgi:hypothetical protein